MTDLLTLPVIPLREAVLFPEVTSPIAAGRAGTLRAIEAALRTESKQIFVVSQRENREDVTSDILYSMGCVATIGPVQRGPSGMRLLLNGNYRAVAVRYDEQDEYLVASIHEADEMSPLDPEDATWREQLDELADSVRRWTGNNAGIAEVSEGELPRLRKDRPPVVEEVSKDAVDLAGEDTRKLLRRL